VTPPTATDVPTIPAPVAGSFRDPHARVHDDGERILRALDPAAAAAFDALERSLLYRSGLDGGRIIGTRRATGPSADALTAAGWAAVLEHDRVPVVSYPYEWSFSMLRDAALLHLELVGEAVRQGMGCKDGSAFNLQFVGCRPVFIDVSSFVPAPADLWPGYRQFCSQLLYPLLLEAHLGVSPAPLQRGSIEGIAPDVAARLLRGTATFRPGVLTHVKVQALAARRYATRADPAAAAVHRPDAQRDITLALVGRLTNLISRLRAPDGPSEWSEYSARGHYGAASLDAKDRFVAAAIAEVAPRTVLDLGANDGRYSLLALDRGAQVVAVDADRRVIDRLYRQLRASGRLILPLVADLADPSPALGWGLRERTALADRIAPDLALALALIHHLVIGRSIPIDGVLDSLAATAPHVVLEVPHRDDPMVQRLLAPKPPDVHLDYHEDRILAAVRQRFVVVREERLEGGTRTILRLRRR
jgi:SAM-dependent methyltransferase